MRIIFMGTPDFAVASLKKLVDSGYNIIGVITAPDRPAGRGRKIQKSAVKEFAEEKNLRILQPTNLKSAEFQSELKTLQPDLQVVVAFRMLPKSVWQLSPKGTINLHASLLPDYRGAAPINWAIINGEKETGVTTFFINENIDTGDVILQEKVSISDDENAGELHDKLMEVGADLLAKTVSKIKEGNVPKTSQSFSDDLKKAPKIFKEDTRIDFSRTVYEVHNFIRGLSPYPAATTTLLNGEEKIPLKIFKAEKPESGAPKSYGQIQTDQKTHLEIACADGWIDLLELQPAGKKRMDVRSFLNGFMLNKEAEMG